MRRLFTMAAVILLSILAPACGGGTSGSSGGGGGSSGGSTACSVSDTSGKDGGGATVKIGSKDFTEEKLLATITKDVLQKHNFTVQYSTVAKDPTIDQALTQGSIDMLWQYTGTELQSFLNVDSPPTDLDQAFQLAKQKDAARNLCWVAPAPLDDTNGLAIQASKTSQFGSTLSDFTTYLGQHPETTVCIASEFRARADGLPGLVKTYGSAWSSAKNIKDDAGSEGDIATGQCDAGEVFTTDAAIAAKGLHVLTDDKKFFPPDNVGLIVRNDILQAHPAISNLMTPVAAKLTTDVITGLNKQVDIDKQSVDSVAMTWLTQNGFLS